jgi:hypothetical protein
MGIMRTYKKVKTPYDLIVITDLERNFSFFTSFKCATGLIITINFLNYENTIKLWENYVK